MIRALIGRAVLACIEQAKQRRFKAEVRQVDPARLTDAELSDWMHGRPIDWSRPGITRIDHEGRVS